MKKMYFAILLTFMTVSAFAAEKGEMYLGPVIGYHYFHQEHDLDDNIEGGLRYGYFFATDLAAELEVNNTKTEYEGGSDKNVTSLSISAAKFFNVSDYYKPFVFIGAGELFAENENGALVAGVGTRFLVNNKLSIDLRFKDMLYTIDGRNDMVPSIAANFHFGSSRASSAAYTPMPVQKLSKAHANQEELKKDSDSDGVSDDADLCAETPAGYPVDSTGCALDSDKDGVYDFKDRCPDTIKGAKVNSFGCFIATTLQLRFKTDSAVIDEKYLGEVEKFVDFMEKNPTLNIEVQGHADNRGTAAYNFKLSKERAEAGVKLLVEKYGINPDRLFAEGYGEQMPLHPNDSPENMEKNRSVGTIVK